MPSYQYSGDGPLADGRGECRGPESGNKGEVRVRFTFPGEELTFFLAIHASHRRCRDQERNVQS
jgi:hypothetical protein